MVSPDSQAIACPLSGRNSTYRPVQISGAGSGYRLYAVDALKKVPFALNTDDFHFDTEIIIQFVFAKLRIKELPIPTYYGDEICRVNGIKYAANVMIQTALARSQSFRVWYDPENEPATAGESGGDAHRKPGGQLAR